MDFLNQFKDNLKLHETFVLLIMITIEQLFIVAIRGSYLVLRFSIWENTFFLLLFTSVIVLRVRDVKVISLDVTGTLVSERFVDFFWLELMPRLFAERHGVDITKAKRIVYSSYDAIGKNDIRWYVPSYWFELFDLRIGVHEALKLIRNEVEVYHDVREALTKMSFKYDLVISSNLSKEFIEVALDVLGFRRFKAIFSCVSDLGLISKTPEFYRFVAERLGVRTEEVLHVGDDQERDYENPIRAGMKAVLINRSGTTTHPHVKNLMELLDVLDLVS